MVDHFKFPPSDKEVEAARSAMMRAHKQWREALRQADAKKAAFLDAKELFVSLLAQSTPDGEDQ